jgi:hypothetical protein
VVWHSLKTNREILIILKDFSPRILRASHQATDTRRVRSAQDAPQAQLDTPSSRIFVRQSSRERISCSVHMI